MTRTFWFELYKRPCFEGPRPSKNRGKNWVPGIFCLSMGFNTLDHIELVLVKKRFQCCEV